MLLPSKCKQLVDGRNKKKRKIVEDFRLLDLSTVILIMHQRGVRMWILCELRELEKKKKIYKNLAGTRIVNILLYLSVVLPISKE